MNKTTYDKIYGGFDLLCFCLFIYSLYLTYFHLRLEGSDNKIPEMNIKDQKQQKRGGKMYFKLQTNTVIKIGKFLTLQALYWFPK